MLQRIQTLWLLLAGTAALLTLKFNFYGGILKHPANAENIYYVVLNGKYSFLTTLITTAIGITAFITIGLFKKRVIQLRLCVLGIILEALLLFLYYRAIKSIFAPGQGEYSVTALLHSLVVLFFMLAARGISKDEKLIKESDRLR